MTAPLPLKPAPAFPTELVRALRKALGADAVLTGGPELAAYDCDAYPVAHSAPTMVVLPESTAQVAEIVRLCNQFGVLYIPRGAGTGLSGGATPIYGGVVISLARMNRILEIDPVGRRIRAQAGAISLGLSKAVESFGLHYAPDPSSQGVCTVGGNVAENSGGAHTLKYGVTTNHTVGLTMVLPSGEVVELGSEVEDTAGLDLVGFVCGSEGTLGIVTEVVARLTPLPRTYRTLLAIFETLDDTTRAVADIIASGIIPCALEMIDQNILRYIEEAYHLGFPPDCSAVLLIELDGFEAGIDADTDAVRALCTKNKAREVRTAANAQERDRLWLARKRGIGVMGRHRPSHVTQDGVIPRSKLPEVLAEVSEIAARHGVTVCNIFHAGDGNLHPAMVFDERDPEEVRRITEAGEEILRLCVRVGGTITGEHGVGIEKLASMGLVYSQDDLGAMAKLRGVFDPSGLCNPGKLIPAPVAS